MKILIVDDHALFREGLKYVLQGLDDDLTVLESEAYVRAMQHISENPDIDLVLLDLNIPGKDGFATLDELINRYPTLPVVIISASTLRSDTQRALDAGAMGYISKESTSTVMLTALKLILAGGIYVPPNMLTVKSSQGEHTVQIQEGLTERQMQVLALLVQGCTNKEIATKMEIAEPTVKMHISAILKTLDVSNRTQAALAVGELGIVLPVMR